MGQTVTARPSHYDVLGVTPDASSDEIVRAFAREMSKPRAFGGLADVSIAYEVLRNPGRRRAYDASIAPKAEPKPQSEPFRRPHALHARPQFIAAALSEETEERVPEPRVKEPMLEITPVEKANEPSLPPFFANALREIADPAPLAKAPSPSTPPRQREIKSETAPAPIPRMVIEPMFAEEGTAPWKKIAIPAGAAILAVAIIGAWAGSRGKTEPSIDAKAAALIAPPTTFDVKDPAADTLAKVEDDVPPPPVEAARPRHHAERIARTVNAKPPSQLADLDRQLAEPAPEPAPEQAAAAEAAPKAIAASMPLPNSVIARTIGRIGYPCEIGRASCRERV